MARGKSKSGTGAKRGPKPKASREDLEAMTKLLSTQLRQLKKLVRQIHAEVVPGSTEGTPEPEIEAAPETPPASVNGATLPVEAEVEVTVVPPPTASVASSLDLKPANN